MEMIKMKEEEYHLYERRQRQKDKRDSYDESPNNRLNRLMNSMGKMKEIRIMLDNGDGIKEIADYLYSINTELSMGECLQIAHNIVVQDQSPP
jgi:6-phosphogluconate dehydrogenase (decarboxylating)